jgi:Metal binding domain of Ada/Flagellar biosynthesis protein, FliO
MLAASDTFFRSETLIYAAPTITFLVAALLLLLIFRHTFRRRLRGPETGSARRLGIVKTFALDQRRQLVVIRRDDKEHLVISYADDFVILSRGHAEEDNCRRTAGNNVTPRVRASPCRYWQMRARAAKSCARRLVPLAGGSGNEIPARSLIRKQEPECEAGYLALHRPQHANWRMARMTIMFTKSNIAGIAAEQDPRWQAVALRDRNFDGHFYYCVKTTGVYCRPSCAARLAKPANVRSFRES